MRNPFQIRPMFGKSRAESRRDVGRMTMGAAVADRGEGDDGGIEDVAEAKLPLANPSVPTNTLNAGDYLPGTDEQRNEQKIDALLKKHGTTAKEVVQFVLAEQKRMAERRMLQERDWALNLAFSEGRQWLGYDDTTKRLVSLMNEDEKDRYITVNLLGYNVRKLTALCTQNRPDASAAPQTDAPMDHAAAATARAINSHCDRLFDRQTQTQERVKWAVKTTTVFTKVVWDSTKYALMPKIAPDGSIIGSQSAQVGEVDEVIVPAFELFCNASAMTWPEVRDVHHVKLRSVSWAQERYGKRGRAVKGDQRDVTTGYADAYMMGGGAQANGAVQGDSALRWGKGQADAAYAYERWELKSPRYPKGRFILVMGGQLLDYREYPYKDREGRPREDLPFVPLTWESVAGSPYGRSPVQDAIPLQMVYNRVYSSLTEQIEAQIDYAIIEEGSKIGADAWEGSSRTLRKIYHATGRTAPVIVRSPGQSMDRYQFQEATYERIQDIFGLHDAMNGKVQNGATSGIAINLQQQSDQSHISLFVSEIEASAVKIKEWEIALYEQFGATVPRLLGVSDVEDTKLAASNATAFKAFTDGGQTRVLLRAGSAMPKSAAGQRQEAMELFDRGVFGAPGTPGAAKLLLHALELPESDQMYENIDRWTEAAQAEAQAAAPNPQEEAAAKLQTESQLIQAKVEGEIAKYRAQVQADVEKYAAEADIDVGKEARIRDLKPAIGPISVKGDAAFTLAAEEATGVDPHSAGSHLAALAAVNPAHAAAAHGVNVPMDPNQQAQLDVDKQAAMQSMQPPDDEGQAQADAPPAPDPQADHERALELIKAEADQKIRVANAAPKPATGGQ